jgi:hypothetical protein
MSPYRWWRAVAFVAFEAGQFVEYHGSLGAGVGGDLAQPRGQCALQYGQPTFWLSLSPLRLVIFCKARTSATPGPPAGSTQRRI